jgi:electron transfer flavoprotein alpha subunit
MSNDVFVIAEQLGGKPAPITFEMLGKGRELADSLGGSLVAVLLGNNVSSIAGELGVANQVLYIEHEQLAAFSPEAYQRVLKAVLEERKPKLTMIGNTSMGMDLAPALSVQLGVPLASYCNQINVENSNIVCNSQVYGGKLVAEVAISGEQAIVSVLAGSFPEEKGQGGQGAQVETMAPPVSLDGVRARFKSLIEPESTGVDITKEEMLVSVGRGIQSQENIEVVQALADALGAALSASRPITDSGWLPKNRQVGKSGVAVKPKLYLMVGISGAPEHLEGMRSADFIIAINSDANAPIFDVAHYGVVADLFDLIPALTEKVKAAKG